MALAIHQSRRSIMTLFIFIPFPFLTYLHQHLNPPLLPLRYNFFVKSAQDTTQNLASKLTMIESIAIRLTIWQATTAIVTLLVSLCSLIWTVYSKCEDWKIAKADKTEREQSEGENNASTAEKLEYHRQRVDKLEKELQQALNDNNALKKQWQGSYQR